MLNGGQVIVDYLIREKVPYVFGLCGHGNIGFIDALLRARGARSRRSRRITRPSRASWPTSITASAASRPRLSPPAARARPICRSRSPTRISIRCRSSRSPATCRPGSSTAAHSRNSTGTTRRTFPSTVRAYCKQVFQPTRGEQVPLAVRQAWKTMVTGRPGPVVLDVPFDIFKEAAPRRPPTREEWSANISCRCGADPEGVAKAVDMLLAAERPVILVGQGVRYGGASGGIAALAERLQIPVASSASGLGAHRRAHPLALGLVSRGGALSGQPRGAAGRRAAGARRALRRPHLVARGCPVIRSRSRRRN